MNEAALTDERITRQITQRLSLRKPQEEALNILAEALTHIDFAKPADLADLLKTLSAKWPSLTSFERDFPSICFSLATGVGKTRLMGAFIAYLYTTGRSKNFFVLAPNTTIYDKLVADFSRQSSPKYVFRGIAEFAQNPPSIITGDTWQDGRGVRGTDLFGTEAIINIFNVDKINKEAGRIKKFRETIGDSYFDYLAALPDLVLMMDEAHRYRAKAATRAIFELSPRLGLELTATPKTVGASPQPFKNVVYDYRLANAMADGFVKEPAVLTRANFQKQDYDADRLEQIMLEDGVHYHEEVNKELELFALNTGQKRVYPFMLVVAQDTTHAAALKARIESDDFFNGNYKGRVIEVHSRLSGEESDEAMARLLSLETANDTDIVIHVNKLKEGWDVTNLFTIVPLRLFAADILTEQTLGRGLRLPYGVRTGNDRIDTLTIVAHDRFDAIIDEARKANSIVQMKALTIGEGGDVSTEREEILELAPPHQRALAATPPKPQPGMAEAQTPFILDTPQNRQLLQATVDIIREKYEGLPGGAADLKKPEVQERIIRDVARMTRPEQASFEAVSPAADLPRLVAVITAAIAENTIDIPEIVVLPSREVNFWYDDFDLTGLDAIQHQPASDTLLVRTIRDDIQRELARSLRGPREETVENYIVKHLIDYPEVDYDTHADLLYKLAGQMVARLRSYLATEDDVENVALSSGRPLADVIMRQMKQHYRQTPAEYRAKVARTYRTLASHHVAFTATKRLPLTQPATPLSATPSHVFYDSKKSPYEQHKFQSDTERRFAVMIDSQNEPDVLRWLKPGPRQFQIEYRPGKAYEPDFVIETRTHKLIVEIKATHQIRDPEVAEKKRAALAWIAQANALAAESGAKPWEYALVPDAGISAAASLEGIMARYR